MEKVDLRASDVVKGKSVLLDGSDIADGQYGEDPFFVGEPKNLLVKVKGYHLMVILAADFDTSKKDLKDTTKELIDFRKGKIK